MILPDRRGPPLQADAALDYVEQALEGFLNDPADTDYQRGYLAALLDVRAEAMGKRDHDGRVAALAGLRR